MKWSLQLKKSLRSSRNSPSVAAYWLLIEVIKEIWADILHTSSVSFYTKQNFSSPEFLHLKGNDSIRLSKVVVKVTSVIFNSESILIIYPALSTQNLTRQISHGALSEELWFHSDKRTATKVLRVGDKENSTSLQKTLLWSFWGSINHFVNAYSPTIASIPGRSNGKAKYAISRWQAGL